MRLNVMQTLKDYKGEPILNSKDELTTLREVIYVACNTFATDEKGMTAEEKSKLFQITTKVYEKNEVSFTVDQLAKIKDRVGKICPPLIYGRICEILDKEDDLEDGGEAEESIEDLTQKN